MSDTVATAQPEQISAPEATPAPAASPSPEISSPSPGVAPQDLPKLTLDQILSKVYDEQNAAPKKEEVAPAEPTDQQPAVAAAEPASSPAIGPPNSWSSEYQAKWNALPPEVQRYVHDRESQIHRQISQQGNELKQLKPVASVLDQFKGQYFPPGREAEFVQQLAMANAALHERPAEVLQALAQHYGIDLAKLGQPQQPNGQAQANTVDDLFKDPRVDQLRAEYDRKFQQQEQYIRQLGGHLSARERAEAEQRHLSATEVISAFSKDKADWADLEDDIIREVKIVKEADPRAPMDKILADAYDRARWANPNIRQRILEQERRAEADKAQKELAKKQAEAKRHAATNVRTGATPQSPTVGAKWNDDAALSAIYDRITSR